MKCLRGRVGDVEMDELKESMEWRWIVSAEPS